MYTSSALIHRYLNLHLIYFTVYSVMVIYSLIWHYSLFFFLFLLCITSFLPYWLSPLSCSLCTFSADDVPPTRRSYLFSFPPASCLQLSLMYHLTFTSLSLHITNHKTLNTHFLINYLYLAEYPAVSYPSVYIFSSSDNLAVHHQSLTYSDM